MTEIRTTSATGGQKGVKAERHDLMPKAGLDAIARVFAFGAEKYADHNWRRGYEWGKSYAALQRHLTAFWDGETHDPESGLPHLSHAGFHVLVLLTWLAEQGEGVDNPFDDRWPHSMERARLAEEAEAEEEEVVVDWRDPQTITLEATGVSLETIALALGLPVAEVELMSETAQRRAAYSIPHRFVAGVSNEHVDPAPLAHFTLAEDGEVTQNYGPDLLPKRAPCYIAPAFERQPGFHVDSTGEAAEDFGARWVDSGIVSAYDPATEAADIVTGQRTNGVQRAFDLR